MTRNLIQLWHMTGTDSYRANADAILEASATAIARNLFAAAGMLSALDFRLTAMDIAIVAPDDASAGPLIATARRHWQPGFILSRVADGNDLPTNHPAAGKTAVRGSPTAYVCRGETCSLPVTEPEDLAALLTETPR
jgi:uncharacterized protein YyaL (SSP411 family)